MLQSIDLTATEQQQKDYIYIYIYIYYIHTYNIYIFRERERERDYILYNQTYLTRYKNIATFEEGISLHGQ